jgi:hemerythrin-like domain-containing protein
MATTRDGLLNRRDALGRIVLAAGAVGTRNLKAADQDTPKAAEGSPSVAVTPPEDLMREHAVLARLLLIYEKILAAIPMSKEWPSIELVSAAKLIRSFIEDYHEKLEEDYVFPLFEKAGKLTDLTFILRGQHGAGRRMTDTILALDAQPLNVRDPTQVMDVMKQFLRMYRPHAARESTVLFPQIAATVGPDEYDKLGDRFEDIEHEKFGPKGFEGVVDRVATIEKTLGIYDLTQFTRPAIS